MRIEPKSNDVQSAIHRQLQHGRYAPSTLYGDGEVSQRIATGLATLTPYIQKRLHFIHETDMTVKDESVKPEMPLPVTMSSGLKPCSTSVA